MGFVFGTSGQGRTIPMFGIAIAKCAVETVLSFKFATVIPTNMQLLLHNKIFDNARKL